MSTSISIGFSQAYDPQEAAYQAALAVKNQLKTTSVDMVLLFTSIDYAKKEVLDVIHSVLSPKKLVGSSSAGIILPYGIFNQGIAIIAINSSNLHFGIGASSYNSSEQFRQFGFELNRRFLLDYKTNAVKQASVFFCDGLIQYNNQFILGAQEILGHTCPIIGAFSCDDMKFKRNFQFYQKQLLSRSGCGFVIGSDSSIVYSNKHGFIPLGKPRTITSAEGSIIRTIDDYPAIHIYEEFLKEDSKNLSKGFINSPGVLYPLGIYLEEQRQYLIRYPVDILSDGSIVCQADVPANAEVHLMINNKESCKKAATAAAKEIKDALRGRPPQLIIVFESVIRYKTLGRHLLSEIQAISEVLGPSIPIVGMYTFGELCPLGTDQDNTEPFLQNASLMLLGIS